MKNIDHITENKKNKTNVYISRFTSLARSILNYTILPERGQWQLIVYVNALSSTDRWSDMVFFNIGSNKQIFQSPLSKFSLPWSAPRANRKGSKSDTSNCPRSATWGVSDRRGLCPEVKATARWSKAWFPQKPI